MIRIFATQKEFSEIEISGSHEELRYIEFTLKYISTTIELEADQSSSPYPYESLLSSLKVEVTEGPTCVSIDDNNLIIKGSRSNLQRLATFFHFLASETNGSHNHFEYFDGNKHIDTTSIPLIVSIDDQKA